MAEINFTPGQKQAIFDQGQNILVAASAGSGKTRVLVQRVIEKIKQGTDIDQLLIVTFTEAAAAEMRDRIKKALEKELQTASPAEVHRYRQQLVKLNVANISTIDAFCLQIIRRYYYVINLDPGFRMLTDTAEQTMLMENVWEDVREQYYQAYYQGQDTAEPDCASFKELADNFTNDRDDEGLTTIVLRAYRQSLSLPHPQEWLRKLGQAYRVPEAGLGQMELFRQGIIPLVQQELEQQASNLTLAQTIAENNGFDKAAAKIADDQAHLRQVLAALAASDPEYATIQVRLAFTFTKKYYGRNLDPVATQEKERIKALIDDVKKTLKNLSTRWFGEDEQAVRQTLHACYRLANKLAEVTLRFMDAYAQEKRRRHLLEFNDLEHLSLQILQNEDVQTSMRNQFAEIMIDEYQDTNHLQEAILTSFARTKPGNLFMVGDVKQSIYGFRSAEPQLFLDKYHRYAQTDNDDERVILAENFRSVQNVADFTNLIFSQLMDQQVGEMDYDTNAQLKFGAKYYPQTQPEALPADVADLQAEILLYCEQDGATEEPVPDKVTGQVQLLIAKIQELCDGSHRIFDRKTGEMRPVTYSDIAILTRTRGNNNTLMDYFSRAGIPLYVNDAANYFQTTEIRIMVSLLKIIDNPRQDIPLVAVLRSPIVGLKENDLARIRLTQRDSDYYTALTKYWQTHDELHRELWERVDQFMRQLTAWRDLARQQAIADLIWDIYDQTGFIDYVAGMPGGPQRQANLHALYDRAAAYEKTSFKGLFQFIRFVERMEENNDDLNAATTQSVGNTVTVMTIHGSKGLEFPIVVLFDATHQFNLTDERQSVIFTPTEGAGLTYVQPLTDPEIPGVANTATIKSDSLVKLLAQNRIARKNRAEAMRLLYVALTRAEQKLLIIGAYDKQDKVLTKWQGAAMTDALVLPAGARAAQTSLMDWLGMCLIRSHKFGYPLDTNLPEPTFIQASGADFSVRFIGPDQLPQIEHEQPTDVDQWLTTQTEAGQEHVSPEMLKEMAAVLNHHYDQLDLTRTTAFQSVSDIRRLFEDPDTERMGRLQNLDGAKNGQVNRYLDNEFSLPSFMPTMTKPVSAAQIGTATHLLFQKMDLHQEVTKDRVQAMCEQLVQDNLLSQEVAAQINLDGIVNFYQTPVGQLVLAHPDQVFREVPFSLVIQPEKLFAITATASKPILVHGIIDGYVDTGDEVVIFDYKTNHPFGHMAATSHAGAVAGEDAQAFSERMKREYQGQLNLYQLALQQMVAAPVTHKYLYLTQTGETVEV